MNVSDLQRGRLSSLLPVQEIQPVRTPELNGLDERENFQNTLRDAIQQVDASQKAADQQISAFVAGEQENLHEVMISMEQAKTSFNLMSEVRNRMLETYQELMRMQV